MEKVALLNYTPNDLRYRGNNANVRICPCCGKKWKLNINFEKNVFRCPACNFHGNAVLLHAKLNNISLDKAYEELKMADYKPNLKKQTNISNEEKLASEWRRNFIYSLLISSGTLTDLHKDNLLKRGVPTAYLKEYVSCSTVPNASELLASKNMWFINSNDNYKLNLIPGFYGQITFNKKNNIELHDKIKLNLPKDGFLIPIISHVGYEKRISCFQIRKDFGDTRYIYLSSAGKTNGISVNECNKVHFTRNFWVDESTMNIPETVNLTEGALKADVASYLSNQQFIAMPGVNSTKGLEKELLFLKQNGCKKINIYFDTDYATNPNVYEALDRIKFKIVNAGLLYKQVVWNNKYKGIDDYLAHFKSNERENV